MMKTLLGSVVFVAATAALSALADATWKAAADGDWEVPSNWSTEALPLATERALITPADNAYTVTVSSAQTVRGLTLDGAADTAYRTRLNVNAPLTVDGMDFAARHCDINIGPSGTFELKNPTGVQSTVGRGGRIVVDGGAFVMTNGISGSVATLYLGEGSPTVPGGKPSFILNSGNAYFKGASTMFLASSSWYSQILLNGGRMEFIDTSSNKSSVLFYAEANGDATDVFTMGGKAELVFTQGGSLAFGRGVSTFKDQAKVIVNTPNDSNYLTFGPYSSDSGRTSTINISDDVTIDAQSIRSFVFGKAEMRTVRSLGYLNVSGGTMTFGYRSELGVGTGTWEMNQTGGHVKFARYGLRIGGVPTNPSNIEHANAKDLCCTSTVTVAGGIFECEAGNAHGTSPDKAMWGMIVGSGTVGRTYDHLMNGWTDARLVLKDTGTISCGVCPKIIGLGKAVASVTQTGGTYTGDCAPDSQNWNWPREAMVIGAFGGKGTYEMSGGTATDKAPLYVGGTTLELLQRNNQSDELPADTTGKAEGTLRISGGTMSFGHHGVVGLDGSGTIELSGSGSLTINGYLTLTNSAVVGSSATVKVTVTGEQAPTFKVTGALNVDAGSKLVVDATGFTGERPVKLIDCARRNGDFAEADIALTGASNLKIRQADDGCIYLVPQHGMMLLVR